MVKINEEGGWATGIAMEMAAASSKGRGVVQGITAALQRGGEQSSVCCMELCSIASGRQ